MTSAEPNALFLLSLPPTGPMTGEVAGDPECDEEDPGPLELLASLRVRWKGIVSLELCLEVDPALPINLEKNPPPPPPPPLPLPLCPAPLVPVPVPAAAA